MSAALDFPPVLLIGNYAPDEQQSMQRYAEALLGGLQTLGWRVELVRPQARFGRWSSPGHEFGKWLGYFDKFVLFPRELRRRVAAASHGQIVHICDHSNAIYISKLHSIPHLITCHDVIAIRGAQGHFPQNAVRASGRRLQAMVLAGLRHARQLVCVSEETRRQLLGLGGFDPARVTMVSSGLNYPYRPLPEAERTAVLGAREPLRALLGRRYVFHVGGNQWYKNRAGVVRIYAEYARQNPAGLDLVLAGKALPAELVGLIAANGLGSRVHEIGTVSNAELNALYSGADCLLFPSRCEGLGWPILEAMAAGTRVMTTGRPPMNDVGGPAAVYVDPENETEAAVRLAELLAEAGPVWSARISAGLAQARKFSTQAMMEGYVGLYQKIARSG